MQSGLSSNYIVSNRIGVKSSKNEICKKFYLPYYKNFKTLMGKSLAFLQVFKHMITYMYDISTVQGGGADSESEG